MLQPILQILPWVGLYLRPHLAVIRHGRRPFRTRAMARRENRR